MPIAHVALPPDRRTPNDLALVGLGAQPGQVAIMAAEGGESVLCTLSGAIPTVIQNTGWETVARPKKRSLVEWVGHDPIRVQFGVMLNAMGQQNAGQKIERACRTLEKLAGAQHGKPPVVKFDSAGLIPYDHRQAPGATWVIEAIDWGDAYRDRRGRRERQFADLTLLQFVEDVELAGLPAVMKQAVREADRKYVDARAGESLRDIAKRTDTRLADLKELNDIRDGDKTLKTGQRIRIK